MKSCCFAVLFLVIVSCIIVADAAPDYRNRKRSSDDSADSIINKIDAGLNLEDGDIIERGLDGKRSTDGDLLQKRAAKTGVSKWPGGVVPYRFAPHIRSDVEKNLIKQAMKNIEAKTCIKFRPRIRTDRSYLFYTRGRGCSSPVGMNAKSYNRITLQEQCTKEVGVVEHEIIHSLGFWHEQSRPDRDRYVKINIDNVIKASKHNFDKHTDADTQGLAYDLGSLMHYGNKDFTKNGRKTIESKTDPNKALGNRKGMTALDIKGINILYNCKTGRR